MYGKPFSRWKLNKHLQVSLPKAIPGANAVDFSVQAGEKHRTHRHVNCEKNRRYRNSFPAVFLLICVSGQVFICHWIYALSASATLFYGLLCTGSALRTRMRFTLATHEPRQTNGTFRKPPVLKIRQLPEALHAFNPTRAPSSPPPSLCIQFSI